jgi:ATP-binding cassette subfamily B protein
MSSSSAPPAEADAAAARPGFLGTFHKLWPYLWPHGRPDLQQRILAAFVLLLAAKLVTVLTPFTFKWATDALVAATGGPAAAPAGSSSLHWLWGRRWC